MSEPGDDNNRANQLNPNNDAYYQSRGYESKDDYDNQDTDDYDENCDEDYDEDHDEDYDEDHDEYHDTWDPEEEPYEYEDMPGDSSDEREEAYDNMDWDAFD